MGPLSNRAAAKAAVDRVLPLVRSDSKPGALAASLAFNRNFDPPNVRDCARGIDLEDPAYASELLVGCAALPLGFLLALPLPARLTARAWIERERHKRQASYGLSALSKLAAELLGEPLTPGLRKRADWKALKRSLERSAAPTKAGRTEQHGDIKSRTYRQLIADLPGGELGNPYASEGRLKQAYIQRAEVDFIVWGDWRISEELQRCRRKHTGYLPMMKVHARAGMAPYEIFIQDVFGPPQLANAPWTPYLAEFVVNVFAGDVEYSTGRYEEVALEHVYEMSIAAVWPRDAQEQAQVPQAT